MKNRYISIVVGLLLVLGVGSIVYTTKKSPVLPVESAPVTTKTVSTATTPASVQPATQTSQSGGITLAQIATHNSRTSCWSAVNGGVYDLTSWIPNHPGGEGAILSLCGIDGSDRYNGQHGDSSKTARILTGFKIGTFIN